MTAAGLAFERFRSRDREEWLMRIGRPSTRRPILFVPPLFEEMNRTRALIVAVMRAAGERRAMAAGCSTFRGTGESERALGDVRLGRLAS